MDLALQQKVQDVLAMLLLPDSPIHSKLRCRICNAHSVLYYSFVKDADINTSLNIQLLQNILFILLSGEKT